MKSTKEARAEMIEANHKAAPGQHNSFGWRQGRLWRSGEIAALGGILRRESQRVVGGELDG